MTQPRAILFVTTADTDLLTADRALAGVSFPDFPRVEALNPTGLNELQGRDRLLNAVAAADMSTFFFDNVPQNYANDNIAMTDASGMARSRSVTFGTSDD